MAYNRPESSYGDNKQKFKRTYQRRKICKFCADSNLVIDYKDYKTLRYFTTERG
ncbi:MAG: 30S ribosomal protein S18, partial [Desulfobacterales bacterium]|nr:30S ribosomal protein S18 [Desulfobacterales bacterium]